MKYDDASWHYAGEGFPASSPEEYGAVHIGLFLKWCFQQGWAGDIHTLDPVSAGDVQAVISGAMTGTEFFLKHCDGKLTDEDFTDKGNAFAAARYDRYLEDYGNYFTNLMYSVEERQVPFDELSRMIRKRYRGFATPKWERWLIRGSYLAFLIGGPAAGWILSEGYPWWGQIIGLILGETAALFIYAVGVKVIGLARKHVFGEEPPLPRLLRLGPKSLYNWYRKSHGTWTVEDPRPAAARAPYTFYLPPKEHLAALQTGDKVKLILRSVPEGLEYDAERMWVEITSCSAEDLVGTLVNDPHDMPQLHAGTEITFKREHVIDIDTERELPEGKPQSRPQYWDRCFVDRCVLDDGILVDYLYREEPDMGQEDDEYPDSGWRIRGDFRGLSDEQINNRKAAYVALGAVLNRDDSWLHLIEEPIGSKFEREYENNTFVPCDDGE